jgi:hypothetical protein
MENLNLVIITTAIQSLTSYTCFTPEMRFLQVMRTILSVHEKIPNPYIVILDTGTMTLEQSKSISPYVKEIINMEAFSLSKNGGEIIMLYRYFTSENFEKLLPSLATINKLSGRYFLTERFDFKKHDITKNLIKLNFDHNSGARIEGRYFRIPTGRFKYFIDHFREFVQKVIAENLFDKISIEESMFQYKVFELEQSVYTQHLGIGGNFACVGRYNED